MLEHQLATENECVPLNRGNSHFLLWGHCVEQAEVTKLDVIWANQILLLLN